MKERHGVARSQRRKSLRSRDEIADRLHRRRFLRDRRLLRRFAWLLTLIEGDAAGRAYAAYGGVYIAATLVCLWLVEGTRPDRWDLLGVSVCLVGATIILFAPLRTPG